MDKTDLKDLVRQRYGSIAANGRNSGCCAPAKLSCCGTTTLPTAQDLSARMGYSAEELAAVPEGVNLSLGCGNPQAIAATNAAIRLWRKGSNRLRGQGT